ncbi:MFS transporter [Longispora fulva]|uniref:MFS family permease n=1 Tax=Longispora fulva TaxID=619741 RepID=A0A8J7GHI8_9ACTN|nr:MFS transporter [Longispora fulva]MBG6136985.1 MFS family permease [Longispora fulva]GIG61662.1 MFS transporter [Longispora fulva]
MRILLDTRPLRESPAFRRLWAGSALSAVGGQMTTFAVALQVYTLTRSSAAVGAVGLAMAVPAIVVGLLGGPLIDAVDRRRLVLAASGALAAVSALFAVQAFADLRQLWPLYLLVAVQSMLNSVNMPARRTFVPRLLAPSSLPAGAALGMLTMHGAVTVGPVLAGAVAAGWGLRACYLIDALSFAAALYGVFRLPPMPPEGGAARPGLRAVGEGLRFIRGHRVIAGAFLADMSATVLGMPFALFPAINAEHFGGRAVTLGLLTAAPAVGGVLGSALSGPVSHVTRQGRAILVAGAVWGVGLAGFGLSRSLWLALALLVLAGTADVISVVFRTAVVQAATPDRYRGRVSAAEYVVGVGCPQLGNFRAGAVGSLTTPAISAVGGGLATVLGAVLVGLAIPAFRRQQADPASRPAT